MAAAESRPAPTDQDRIHQVVHGYLHGHRLLTASLQLTVEDRRLVDRLSDASGQRPDPGSDGYLTGYPLPSGAGYALAKTWYIHDAPRPNIVWTHTLLVPTSLLNLPAVSVFASLLQRPTEQLAPFAESLSPQTNGAPTTFDANVQVLDLVQRLYSESSEPQSMRLEKVEERNRLGLALWDQQWASLRGSFAFCTGAAEARRLMDRSFDLTLGPGNKNKPPLPEIATWAQALTGDLQEPGALRQFIHAVGGDVSTRTAMVELVQLHQSAASAAKPAVLLRRVVEVAPHAASMRRLKRAVLAPEDGLLADAVPEDVLDALLSPPISEGVLAADSFFATWVDRSWRGSPARVIARLGRLGYRPALKSNAVTEQATLAALGPAFLRDTILAKAGAEHLASLASADASTGADALNAHTEDSGWWIAWRRLEEQPFRALLDRGAPATSSFPAACRELVSFDAGVERWRQLASIEPDAALEALIPALAATGRSTDSWRSVLLERPDQVHAFAGRARTAEELAVLADVISFREGTAGDLGLWAPLIDRESLWDDNPRRAAVVYVACASNPSFNPPLALLHAYGRLYSALADGEVLATWSYLHHVLPRAKHDWDRCQVLAQNTAKRLQSLTENLERVIGEPRAVDALRGEERKLRDEEERKRRAKDAPDGIVDQVRRYLGW